MNRVVLFFALSVFLLFKLFMTILPSATNLIPENADWVLHLISFMILTIILLKIFDDTNHRYTLVAGMMFVIIILSEVVQIPIPGRTFSYYDMLSDAIGLILGYVIDYGMRHKWF